MSLVVNQVLEGPSLVAELANSYESLYMAERVKTQGHAWHICEVPVNHSALLGLFALKKDFSFLKFLACDFEVIANELCFQY